jgi:hypothetical protein
MIEQTMIQLTNPSTKDQIVKKMREIFYLNSFDITEESFQNSVSTLLSSQSCFSKIKGSFKLKTPDYVFNDLKAADTMKLKLRYVLSQFPEHKASITEIKEKFQALFPEIVKDDREKLNTITKILGQSEEFDASNSKTKYCLNVKFSDDS